MSSWPPGSGMISRTESDLAGRTSGPEITHRTGANPSATSSSQPVQNEIRPGELIVENHDHKRGDVRASEPDLSRLDLRQAHHEQKPSESPDRSERVRDAAKQQQHSMAPAHRGPRRWREHEQSDGGLEGENAERRRLGQHPQSNGLMNHRRVEQLGSIGQQGECPTTATWPTRGRESFRGRTADPTATSARRGLARFRRTATASTT